MLHLKLNATLLCCTGPTCILIRPDGETVEAFAFGAETRYSELSENNEHKKWYYFRRFKMAIWKKVIRQRNLSRYGCGSL
ncbi:hypothetical protein DPMN_107385 [Dreissena polymorpha]|uniref:Uncharacterized protein n=1 Tax=Dreissena polymorpha TaxID=45954 RepID=A0A9D4K6M1_DREPO|nr:hypothetical protein DPMN_107385 [Dreissena polymorpha]